MCVTNNRSAFASTRRCLLRQDGEGLAGGGGGTGVLKHIANAYLQPGRLVGGMCGGRKVVAFAITLTMDGHHMDGAAVLAASIGEKK